MTFARRHRASAAACAALLSVLVLSLGATALAAQSTITRQDCTAGRIRDQSGNPISLSRCEKLIGQSITLASTGFDVWIVGATGAACLAGALLLRRPARAGARRR